MVKRSYKHILLSTLILGTSFGATSVFATDPEVDLSVTVNPSLTLSVSSNSVNLPITPDADGEYNTTNFTITSATNNMYGYTLTMSTEDDHTYLESTTVNPATGTKPQIQSLASSQDGISAATFEAATAEANGLNRWGIAIGSGNYNAVTSPKEVKKTTTNNASGVDNTTVNIAAKLNLEVSAGTYKNKFILQMVANPNVGTLEDAYQMAGKTKKTVGNESYYSIQDMNPGICAAAAQSNLQVVDERDNTVYWIGKLADERCWLLDNLALDLTDVDVKNVMYDSSDSTHNTLTNATNEQLGYLFNGGRVSGDSTTYNLPISGLAKGVDQFMNFGIPLIRIDGKDVIQSNYGGDVLWNQTSTEGWKIGIYYDYCAASAGSYCFGSGYYGGGGGSPFGDVSADICPAGWYMPSGGENGEYQVLVNAYPSIDGGDNQYVRVRKALRLPLSGWYYGDNNDSSRYKINDGVVGYFWSSSNYDSGNMYIVSVRNSSNPPSINALDKFGRMQGIPLRCVVR